MTRVTGLRRVLLDEAATSTPATSIGLMHLMAGFCTCQHLGLGHPKLERPSLPLGWPQ